MSDVDSSDRLLAQAVAGDGYALERLLLHHYDALHRHVERMIPADLRALISADEIVQETHVQAFRHIGDFRPRGPAAAFWWLATIAEHKLTDAVRRERSLKRSKGHVSAGDDTWVAELLEHLPSRDQTPSWFASRREADHVVRVALACMDCDDQREALQLRYLEGLSEAETARRMGRTEGAVGMLCSRGRRTLEESLGRMSKYLSQGS